MKKVFFLSVVFLALFIQNAISQNSWNIISNEQEIGPSITILSENKDEIVLKLNVNAYAYENVITPKGTEVTVKSPEGINSMEKGMPDLPYFATSVNIPDKGKIVAEIISTSFITEQGINVAPSRGDIKRNIDPKSVAYEYGKCYTKNEFFPYAEAYADIPFIIRNLRGSNVKFFPFAYNPISKELKIYTEIIVKISYTHYQGENENTVQIAKTDEFEQIYKRMFINYPQKSRYTQLEEGTPGRLLIICKDSYSSAMTDLINWKREKGIETELVLTSVAGSTNSAISNFITSYFASHSDLSYILLVGDAADVPTLTTTNGDSDNAYAFLVGNDKYVDVFMGRFSGNSLSDIQTQVQRTITYEKELDASATWLSRGFGSASSEGGGSTGHNQGSGAESDMVHMGYIQTDLEGFGYNVSRVNQSGGSNANISAAFNQGMGVACYIGHGDTQEWVNTGFSNTQVNALTNENKLPFIFSVACVNGDFNGNTCFAEAWLRATNNGNPTGAIAFTGSTINQAWNAPMTGQDEMIDILVESYATNIKRTISGIFFNGVFKMMQDEGASGIETADTWTLFGDPSLMVRSKSPEEMIISHNSTVPIGSSSITVNCDTDNALVSISHVVDGETQILGTAYVTAGSAIVPISQVSSPGSAKITVTAYNKITYQENILFIVPAGPYIVNNSFSINDESGNNNGIADFSETIKINQTLENVGIDIATAVNMSITTAEASVIDATESFGDIQANTTTTKNNAFEINIPNDIADQSLITINYSISDNNSNSWDGNYSFRANAPKPELNLVRINDAQGNNNGLLDAGESANIVIKVSNIGHANMNAGILNATSPNSFITLLSASENIASLNTNANIEIQFGLNVDENIESGTTASFEFAFASGAYSYTLNVNLPIGLQIEDWESNSFDSYEWENSSSIPWTIVSSGAYEGTYCAKSGQISDSQETSLQITVDVVNNDVIQFYKKVSCEEYSSWWGGEDFYDYLSFTIDGIEQAGWDGEVNWSAESYNVTAGTHTFGWTYIKDISDASGSDCAWIDNITLPAHSNSTVIINTNSNVTQNSIGIYPNPASEYSYLELKMMNDENINIQIFNTNGQLIVEKTNIHVNSGENYIMLDTNNLKSGLYIVKVVAGTEILTKNLNIIK